MEHLSFEQKMADQHIRCSLCEYVIEPGEIFWRGRPSNANSDRLRICTGHIPLNSKGMIVEPSADGSAITYVRADALDVRRDIIPRLMRDSDAIFRLTPEEFEELVFDRLVAMDLQAFRMGPANRKDGGIDVVFWTRGLFPMLGAVQIKHHRSPQAKVGPAEVRELAGAMGGHRFNVGLIITNTTFTEDAKHLAVTGSAPIQLRDGEVLRSWIADDFAIEKLEFVSRNAEFCRGIEIRIPQFR